MNSLASSDERLLNEVNAYYCEAAPQHRHYVRLKMKSDPLTVELLQVARSYKSLGRVIDAGCGRGQYSLLLVALGAAKELYGFDLDASKILVAEQGAELCRVDHCAPIVFLEGDLSCSSWNQADTILLLDVLHYLPLEEQLAVLAKASAVLCPGGRLIIRETTKGSGFGGAVAAVFERIGRLLRINRGRALEFLSPAELGTHLDELGLQVRTHQPQGPLRNVLLVAEKPKL